MAWVIKTAELRDVDDIAAFLYGLKSLYQSQKEKDENSFIINHRDVIKFAVRSNQNIILVASRGATNLGMISGTTKTTIRLNSVSAVIEEIFVCPNFRRRGIGTLLVQKFVDVVRARNVKCIEVVSSLAHPGQRDFFGSLGFEWYSSIHRMNLC